MKKKNRQKESQQERMDRLCDEIVDKVGPGYREKLYDNMTEKEREEWLGGKDE